MDQNWVLCWPRCWYTLHFVCCNFRRKLYAPPLMLLKKTLYFTFGIVLITALLVVYFLYNPVKYRFFPKCPFYSLTGFACPGCGSQRAIYNLLHGNILKAIRFNV